MSPINKVKLKDNNMSPIGLENARILIEGQFARGPKYWVSSHLRSIRAILVVESMKVGTYHFTRVLSPKYDMDAYMTKLYENEA